MTRQGMHVVIYTAARPFGGAENVARLIVSRLADADRVTVVGPTAAVVGQIASGNATAASAISPVIAGKHDLRSALALRRMLRDLDPDVIHFNLSDMASCLTEIMVGASLPGVALVAVEHSGYQPQTRFQRVAKWISVRLLDGHVAVSKPLAALVAVSSHVSPNRVTVIANGVEAVDPYARSRGAFEPLRLGVVTRLTAEKGVDVVIDALASLPGVELHIAGDGPAQKALAERAVARSVADRVHFHGWLSDPSNIYRTVDVYVHPSRADIMPLSVIEAMQHGLPIVATRVGSVGDLVVSGETGFLIEPDDTEACVRSIEVLRDDLAKRMAFGEAGRARALQGFEASSMSEAYLRVYGAARQSVQHRRFRRPRRDTDRV